MKETKSVQGFKGAHTPNTFFTCRTFWSKRKETPFKNTSFTTYSFVPHAPHAVLFHMHHTFFLSHMCHIFLCLLVHFKTNVCLCTSKHTHNQLCTFMNALHVMYALHVLKKHVFLLLCFLRKKRTFSLQPFLYSRQEKPSPYQRKKSLRLINARKLFSCQTRKAFPCQTRRTVRGLFWSVFPWKHTHFALLPLKRQGLYFVCLEKIKALRLFPWEKEKRCFVCFEKVMSFALFILHCLSWKNKD